jgi:hypothetical protein
MTAKENFTEHQDFKRLAAMAALNELTTPESLRLEDHLRSCESCADTYQQYLLLCREGMPFAKHRNDRVENLDKWCEGPWRDKLFDRIQKDEQRIPANGKSHWFVVNEYFPRLTIAGASLALLAFAITFVLGGKILGKRFAESRVAESQPGDSYKDKTESQSNQTAEGLQRRFDERTRKLNQLESDQETQGRYVKKIRADLKDLTEREGLLRSLNTDSKVQLKELTEQRDALKSQLMASEQSYAVIQSQFASLLGERDSAVSRNSALESKIVGLSTQVSNQRRKLEEDEQFLNSDRDIRELMGARQLYIADVFDVDSHSQTRPAFGRIFYTHGKSLIFYAFDLDSQKNAVTASAFQVWGKDANGKTPRSLGILYLDNESKRRWLLRSDNAEQLEKIDSVFVTVEPRGGSEKPTGRPFLYALLRKEPNHP